MHSFVHHRADLVHEQQDVFLQDLVDIVELADVAKPEDRALLPALEHRVHVPFLDNIFAYDLSACTPENDAQQRSYLNDGVAHNGGLI